MHFVVISINMHESYHNSGLLRADLLAFELRSIGRPFYPVQQSFQAGILNLYRLSLVDKDISLDFHITGNMDFLGRLGFLIGARTLRSFNRQGFSKRLLKALLYVCLA